MYPPKSTTVHLGFMASAAHLSLQWPGSLAIIHVYRRLCLVNE